MVDLLDTLHHGEAGIGVEEMVITPASKAIGRTLEEVGLLAPDAAKVLAVRKRDGTVNVNPPANSRLEEDDLVIALGPEDQLFATASKLR
jgi:Trk K+ transport system NAD-binding subunit